ncbi:hypothetical protein C943_02153 [Mariniradius saccharolyticus AK6]|uniref:Uncharacterized protein n=1 Tax=Mariniradius saccharolyticus AK6 TaxID=1239962 RepID=M7XA36_9BACT|nr:hypothetical protein C943_02153 [Mariniradius saccharolyticus AK6]
MIWEILGEFFGYGPLTPIPSLEYCLSTHQPKTMVYGLFTPITNNQ